MRQIKDEYRQNPWIPNTQEEIEAPALTGDLQEDHRVWNRNEYSAKAHRFCTSRAGLNLTNGEYPDAERANFQNCMSKYSQNFQTFLQERTIFQKRMDGITARGENKYAPYMW